MSEGSFSGVRHIVWREDPEGRGIATFEYPEGVSEDRELSSLETRMVAEDLGLVEVGELHEWAHIA